MQTRTQSIRDKKARQAAGSKKKASMRQQDAIALLKSDHDAVDKLFKQYESRKDKTAPDEKQALAEKICLELTVHAIIEEEIFYPAVRDAVKAIDGMLDEAEVEHGSLKRLMAAIRNSEPKDDLYDAHVKVLGEYVKHHVEEEHEEMFPKVKKSKLDLIELGAALAARKAALMEGKRPQ